MSNYYIGEIRMFPNAHDRHEIEGTRDAIDFGNPRNLEQPLRIRLHEPGANRKHHERGNHTHVASLA